MDQESDSDFNDSDVESISWSDDAGFRMGVPKDVLPAPYPLHALDVEKREIRLIMLEPTYGREELRCKLMHVAIGDSSRPAYNALSYTWGDPTPAASIQINGYRMQLTANLAFALRRFSQPDKKRDWLWVDALCIDQRIEAECAGSEAERMHQISLMRDIFNRASKVLVWLGNSEASARGYYAPEMHKNHDPTKECDMSLAFSHAVTNTLPHWWTRVWTVQEFARAMRPPFFCFGGYELQMNDLRFFTPCLSEALKDCGLADALDEREEIIHGASDILDAREKITNWASGVIHVLDVALSVTSRLDTTFEADRLYGVTGLIDPEKAAIVTRALEGVPTTEWCDETQRRRDTSLWVSRLIRYLDSRISLRELAESGGLSVLAQLPVPEHSIDREEVEWPGWVRKSLKDPTWSPGRCRESFPITRLSFAHSSINGEPGAWPLATFKAANAALTSALDATPSMFAPISLRLYPRSSSDRHCPALSCAVLSCGSMLETSFRFDSRITERTEKAVQWQDYVRQVAGSRVSSSTSDSFTLLDIPNKFCAAKVCRTTKGLIVLQGATETRLHSPIMVVLGGSPGLTALLEPMLCNDGTKRYRFVQFVWVIGKWIAGDWVLESMLSRFWYEMGNQPGWAQIFEVPVEPLHCNLTFERIELV